MRKILLATSALVVAASAAQANDLKLEMSGYADFRAGIFDEDLNVNAVGAATPADRSNHDFATEVKVVVDAIGKGAGDFEYGARISLWNGATNKDGFNGGENDFHTHDAYVYMGSNWGRVILGDHTGASDLFVYAPFVGQGQIDGTFSDFTSNLTLAPFFPAYIDNEEVSTKVTYYTPVVSGFQLGASYMPQMYDYGQNVVKYYTATNTVNTGVTPATVTGITNGAEHPYNNIFEVGAQYQGSFQNANVTLSGLLTTGDSEAEYTPGVVFQDFTAWGLGAQVGYAGFTFGGSYYDAGDFLALVGQNEDQNTWSIGATYEFGKAGVGISYVQGQGYTPGLGYIDKYGAVGIGGEYNWMPGLVTAADAVFFDQEAAAPANNNEGQVFLLSQRVNF